MPKHTIEVKHEIGDTVKYAKDHRILEGEILDIGYNLFSRAPVYKINREDGWSHVDEDSIF